MEYSEAARQLESRNAQIDKLKDALKEKESQINSQGIYIDKLKEGNAADAYLQKVFGTHLSKAGATLYTTNTGVQDMNVEELVDAFVTLYDEGKSCARARLQTRRVDMFLQKYKETVEHIKNKRINPDKFEIIKQIGRGTFADILLATFKEDKSKRPLVLKRMLKSKIHAEAAHVWPDVELEVMVKATKVKAPGIVWLQSAFHDPHHLYFAMNFYQGGDMLCMLDRKETFNETWGLFYFGEMAIAVNAVHELGFIHRDLKIENFLLDASGHVILTDFGSACGLINGKCSQNIYITSEYMAPELVRILRGESVTYGPGADWWSLGVILYEMLTGDTPFIGDDLGTIMPTNRIIHHKTEFAFPDHVTLSKDVEILILGLIEDEDIRLGFDGIKNHIVYKHVNWENAIENLRDLSSNKRSGLNVPFKPEVVSNVDTTFFDEFEDDEEEFIDATGNIRKSRSVTRSYSQMAPSYTFGDLLPYVGFSYQRPRKSTRQIRKPKSVVKAPVKPKEKEKEAQKETVQNKVVVEQKTEPKISRVTSITLKPGERPRVRFVDKVVFFELVKKDDAEFVKSFIKRNKIKVNDVTDSFSQSALHIACMFGAEEVVRVLVEMGGKVNLQDDFACTPLHLALVSEENKIAQYLLDHGADVKIKDSDGSTALDMTEDPALVAAIKHLMTTS